MHPYPFAYHRPQSLDEALALLTEHGDEAKLLAGGHSLLPVMKLRLAQPGHIVDISGLTGLDAIEPTDTGVRIGALATHHAIETSKLIRDTQPLVSRIASLVGDTQVRNRGTIGGALAHADPAADYPAGVLVLGATITARGPQGERQIPVSEFFIGFLTTALGADEVLTAVEIDNLPAGSGTAYEKLANPASGYAIAGAAARVTRQGDTITDIAVALTGVGDSAFRATQLEQTVTGSAFDLDAITSAAATVTEGIDVLGDTHAPVAYRTRVARNLTVRAIQHAWEDANQS